jgi:pimeloyl-ACP methyl ester carboxylesterase
VPLTVVAGEQNRDSWMGAAAARLAEGTGADLVELPGGHGGFVSHPQEFIELVRRIVR